MRLICFVARGGATRGLQLAGYHVTGVDIAPQPNYCGDRLIRGDALMAPIDGYDFIWASPPCQAFTAYRRRPNHVAPVANLIDATRIKLRASYVPDDGWLSGWLAWQIVHHDHAIARINHDR